MKDTATFIHTVGVHGLHDSSLESRSGLVFALVGGGWVGGSGL